MANPNNEAIARKALDVFKSGDMSVIDEITAEGRVGHDPANPEETVGTGGAKALIQMYRDGFSDAELIVDEQISDGDYVVTRWHSHGTNDGPFAGMPPTRKTTSVTGITIDKIVDGKMVESWTHWDNMGLMQQLGIGVPAGAAAN